QLADLRIEAGGVAHDLEAHAVGVELLHLARERGLEQFHQQRHFLRRAAPVLGTEGEQREELDAALGAGAHRGAHGVGAGAMAGHARQQPRLRPAAVAVHDDRDVPRHVAGGGNLPGAALRAHMARSSASFCCSILSMVWMCRSVAFCTSSCARRSSFSDTSFFFSASFSWLLASRRWLRMAILAFSASCFTTLISS